MIVEFFGRAGSGKSTVARLISQKYNIPVIKIRSKQKLLYLNLLFSIKHPYKSIRRFFYVASNSINLKMFYYKFMNTFMQVNAKYQQALMIEGVSILDQGYVQSILSMFEKKVSEEQMLKYVNTILFPDKLIIFETTKEILEVRLNNRGYYVRPFLDKAYLETWQKNVDHNYQVLKNILPKFPCEVFIVDSSQTPEEISQEIMNFLNK